MTAKSIDATSSFASLLENLPAWKEQVAALIAHTTQKQQEFRAEYTRLVHQARPRKQRSESVCSVHSNKDSGEEIRKARCSKTPSIPDPVDISPLVAGNRFIYAQANKKRKPGTSFRSGASGPLKFRSKQAVVIYYDSHVQDEFGSLVKALGACRNNLRKGKMAYSVTRGLQLPTLRRGADRASASPSMDSIRSSLVSRPSPQVKTSKEQTVKSSSTPKGEAAFLLVDQELEKCQNLCETAAHQFLRDGDCKLEMDTVMQHFENVLDLAQKIYDSLKLEAESDEKTQDSISNGGSTHTTSDSTLVEKPSREFLNLNRKISPEWTNDTENYKRPSLNASVSAPPLTTDIEVDSDSNASSIDIDINNYRLNNAARHRT